MQAGLLLQVYIWLEHVMFCTHSGQYTPTAECFCVDKFILVMFGTASSLL